MAEGRGPIGCARWSEKPEPFHGRNPQEPNVIELKQESDLATILEESQRGPVLVLKHSTTCPISAGAYRRVDAYLEGRGESSVPVYLVKVIEARPLSNAIARESGVQHASPQMILFHQGRARWDTSHGAITADAIEAALAEGSSK